MGLSRTFRSPSTGKGLETPVTSGKLVLLPLLLLLLLLLTVVPWAVGVVEAEEDDDPTTVDLVLE